MKIRSIAIALAAMIGFAMTACDDGLAGNKGSDPADDLDVNPLDFIGGDSIDESSLGNYIYTIALPAGEPYISRTLGWQWGITGPDGYDFKWIFKNDGTVSTVHCCGYTEHQQLAYLLCGNVLITYPHITYFTANKATTVNMKAATFTLTETENGASFNWNGKTYPRRDPDRDYISGSPLALSNNLLGTWQGDDGAEFEFRSDAGLRIGSEEYGYLVWKTELVTLGPIVDGGQAGLHKYVFNRIGNKLYLKRSDGEKYILSPVE